MARKTNDSHKNKKIDQPLKWDTFNFLENLLVFRLMNEKCVPQESGVKFRVTPKDSDTALTLLFRIDTRRDSLFKNDEIKPDYMVLYVRNDLCLCTIIEMKGTTRKRLEHGIDQIKALRDRLKAEISENIINKFKVKFQAILLTPYNADIPRNQIVDEGRKGLTILPLQYNNSAELYGYISKLNRITERFVPQDIPRPSQQLFIEKTLTTAALPNRIRDSFSQANKDKTSNGNGIYINYAFSSSDYLALAINNLEALIGLRESGEKYKNLLINDLTTLGVKVPQHVQIAKID